MNSSMPAMITWITMGLVATVALLATCFTRVIVVLGLLKQAIGAQQPPPQVVLAMSLLITVVVMAPVYTQVYSQAIEPYSAGKLDMSSAVSAGEGPVRAFMIRQIESTANRGDVRLFLPKELAQKDDLAWSEVATPALVAGFVVSELKIAFIIGVQIFLPFVVIDLLVATILTSMGMLMLPPVLISLPLKLLMFVLADGWHRVIGTLMQSLGWSS